MRSDQAMTLARTILHELAPEVDFEAVDPRSDLGDAFDLDSFGLLTLAELLEQRAGVAVPERDYPRLSSVRGLVDYLVERSS